MSQSKDIVDLNLHFLMLARHMAATDRASACSQLGLSQQDIDTLVNASLTEVVAMATSQRSLIRSALPLRVVDEDSVDAAAMQMTFIGGRRANRAS
ncbi:flagellar transcriptional regulator FlhD [Crenobacter sp. SG2305]|uniref:flagellar transcriptional regulator FlhD n=1 Tax=Crenobacter oryzisoli TaxID=3056844 RepID=UPI0025AA777C|nr:flagellar transcriptional regulator FlhD [Crenobacter sp. SG2305]MDN0082498.1 flagellar transcriptional regulator FlhD [Crenobacter sp. SG2305]